MEITVRSFYGLPLLLAGCGFTVYAPETGLDSGVVDTAGESDADTDADSDTDTDSDTDIDMDALSITGVSPAHAMLSGGGSVVVSGGPFADGATVFFGDEEAAVTLVSANEIVATIPAQDAEGPVDVSVVMGTQGGELAEGFYYFENAAGLGGALGWSHWRELTGGYWSGSYSFGYVAFLFIQPLDIHTWHLEAPAMDSCVREGEYSYGDIYILDIGADTLNLSPQVGTGYSIDYNTSSLFYELVPATEQSFVDGSWYDLDVIGEGLFAGEGITDFYRNTNPPVITEPAISGDFAPTIYPNQTFRWTAGNNDWIEITMAHSYDSTSETYLEQVNCVVSDDGEFQMDASLFQYWSSGMQIDIYFTAVREGGGTLPYNFSESRIVGQYQLIGAGFSQ